MNIVVLFLVIVIRIDSYKFISHAHNLHLYYFSSLSSDYGGWPEVHELPIDHLTGEHRRLIAEKCSENEDPVLPNLPTSMSLLSTADAAGDKKGNSITPPPCHDMAVAEAHRKWQAEAERLGGPNARVVVSKPEAKKLIFDKLHNEFTPMNIDGV